MTKPRIIFMSLLFSAYPGLTLAAFYPTNFNYSEAGFNQSQPLQDKLNTTRGEVLFEKTGIYVGASDVVYADRILNEEYYEMDAYAGIKQLYGNFGYHFGLKSYNRSIEKEVEIQELYIGGNFRNFCLSYATNEDGEYTQINFKHKLALATIGFHVGKTKPMLGESFSDWSVHASKVYKSIQFNAIMIKSEDPFNSDTQISIGLKQTLSLF